LAGLRLLAALETAGLDPFTVAEAKAQGEPLGLSESHTTSLLHRLSTSGRLTRVKKGVYAATDPVTQLPRAHPFAIGTALVTPSAISHWSAFQHWGLTEQIPDAVTLSSPTRTFPPSRESEVPGMRPAWMVAGTRYEVIAITEQRFFGVEHVWLNERDQVAIFDRERSLLDAFQHFHIFGSLSVGLEALEEHLGELDLDRLARYAVQVGVTAVVKRLGWALEQQGAPEAVLAPLRSYPARGDAPLDPGSPSRGRHNSAWQVIENLRG
jgi:predicted transcriptional regulator of viral defense system